MSCRAGSSSVYCWQGRYAPRGRILLLDEPTAGLDPKAAVDLYALIKNLNDGGVTVIMISHDIAASVKYASHILHIGVGEALFFGTAGDLFAE